jgi:prevent-host-death family protein
MDRRGIASPVRCCYISDQLTGQENAVRTINLAEAKARLSELVSEAATGDTVQILRRGKPIAQLTAARKRLKRIDAAALKELTDSMPRQRQSAREFVREMRDNERY